METLVHLNTQVKHQQTSNINKRKGNIKNGYNLKLIQGKKLGEPWSRLGERQRREGREKKRESSKLTKRTGNGRYSDKKLQEDTTRFRAT